MTTTITISIPDSLRKYINYKVRTGCYHSVSEYMRDLIRLDQRIELAQREAARRQSVDPANQLAEMRPVDR